MKLDLRNKKGITLKNLIIIIGVIIIFAIIVSEFTKQPGYKLSTSNGEVMVYKNIMEEISNARNRDDLTGTISKSYLYKLEEILHNADNSYEWFNDIDKGVAFVNFATDDMKVEQLNISYSDVDMFDFFWICIGEETASFVIKNVGSDYYLVDYFFSNEITVGCLFKIE